MSRVTIPNDDTGKKQAVTAIQKSAASRLLDRDMPEDYRAEWTAIVSAQQQKADADKKSVLVFRIGAEWLSISTGVLQEIAELPQVHRLPHRRGGLLNGLVCVRGELLLSIALEVLLQIKTLPEDRHVEVHNNGARLLICDKKGSRFAFPVNEVLGVRTYIPRELKDVPATLAKAVSRHTAGVLQMENRVVSYLDDERLFQFLDKNVG
jgi:chemotaxis-related protein WspD